MANVANFVTEGVAQGERLAGWTNSVWGPTGPSVRASSLPFEAKANCVLLGALRVFRVTASPYHLEQINTHAQSSRRAQIVVQCDGNAVVRQMGRETVLNRGHWSVLDADRSYSITNGDLGEQLILILPSERLGLSASDLAAQAARRFGEASGTARVLPRYLSCLLDELEGVDEGNCSELVDMAAQLVRLAMLEARRAGPVVSMRETLRARVKGYVRRHLSDSTLTIDSVAAALGCTKRYLHKVFSEDEMTLSQFIWTERLDRCREALDNPELGRRSITEIAFMWGFNNSAHFSKTFKERFGMPPGHVRARNSSTMLRRAALG